MPIPVKVQKNRSKNLHSSSQVNEDIEDTENRLRCLLLSKTAYQIKDLVQL